MIKFSNNLEANKKLAFWANSLVRRLVGSNHIPYNGTNWMLINDQIRLISASSNLRNNNYISDGTKNNTSTSEDVVSGSVLRNTASINIRFNYSKPWVYVKSMYGAYKFSILQFTLPAGRQEFSINFEMIKFPNNLEANKKPANKYEHRN